MPKRLVTVTAVAMVVLGLSAAPSPARADGMPAAQARAFRFEIPAGPIDTVAAAFRTVTGCRLNVLPALQAVSSPGVAGVYTVEQALERLLVGTGLAFRLAAADAYDLDVRVEQSVEVTARLTPYRAAESATATKTRTPLRDIPQTLTVVPRQLLADQNAQSVAAAMRNVPGVSIAQGEGNRDQVVLRGISTASDFFVDGIRDDQERFRDLYNVETIEVVQGPAAVLFGRGGAGGVVNLVTRTPVRGAPSDLTLDAGSFGHKRGTLQFGLPVGARGALGLSAMGEDSGGFRDGFFLRRYGVNPTVGLTIGKGTSLTFGYERLHDRRLADRGIPSQAGRPVGVRAGQLFGSSRQNEAVSDADSGSSTIEHRFGPNARLRNSLLVGRYDKFYLNVYPGSAVNASGVLSLSAYDHLVDRTNVFNQTDVIYDATVHGLRHTLLVGTEIGRQFQDEWRHTAAAIPDVRLSNSDRDASFASAPLAINRHASSFIVAGYAQDQIALSARWKAVVGARLDRFAVAVDDRLPGSRDLSRVDVAASPRAGVIYQPTGAASLYTSYSYTFLPSGQTLGLATNTVELAPENAVNYEVGAKLDLLGARLNVAAALFRLDRDHVKNTDPQDPSRLALTGQQRTEGLTISVAGSPLPRWQISGGYSNLNARVTADTAAAPAGRRVGLVPRSQLTLWSTYDLSRRWGAGGGLLGQSRMFASFSNQVELPGFTRADGVVYVKWRGYRIAVNAENLLNSTYYATANGDNNISPGSPRSIQVSLRAGF